MFELHDLNKENAKIDLFKLCEIAKKSASIGNEILLKNYNKSKFATFSIGWIYGFGYFIFSLHWITNSLTFDESYKKLIPFSLILIPFFLGIFYGLFTLFLSWFNLKLNI